MSELVQLPLTKLCECWREEAQEYFDMHLTFDPSELLGVMVWYCLFEYELNQEKANNELLP